MKPGAEDSRAKEHDLPSDLWDRVRKLPLPPAAVDDLIKRMEDIAHKIADAQGHAADAEKRIRDADDGIDKLKTDRIAAEGEKHAAEEERDRQQGRLVALLADSLHDFRPPPPPRPVEDWRAKRWFRPRPVYRHFCPLLYPPPFPALFPPPPREFEYPPPREREFYPPPRAGGIHEPGPPCCGCLRNRDP